MDENPEKIPEKIVPIRPGLSEHTPAAIAKQRHEAVVREVRELLAAVEAGEVTGIAYACQHEACLTSFNWAGHTTRALVGAMEILKMKLIKED